jgi:hypothetical protein
MFNEPAAQFPNVNMKTIRAIRVVYRGRDVRLPIISHFSREEEVK